jgi:hypothetical protein
MEDAAALRDRVVAAIEGSDPHFERAGRALTAVRTLTGWAMAVAALGAVAATGSLSLLLALGAAAALSLIARVRIADGLRSFQLARHQARDLGDPSRFSPGGVLTLRAGWEVAAGNEEPVMAEIVADDGRDGTARILCEPQGGALIIPNASVIIVARKGDLVRYTRGEGTYPYIWGLAGPASPLGV